MKIPTFFITALLIAGMSLTVSKTIKNTRRYFRDRVILRKDGMEVWEGRGKQEARWDEVDQFETDRRLVTLTRKNGTTLRFDTSVYAYGNELPDLIREHIERAKIEAERAATLAADVVQPELEMRAWTNQPLSPEDRQEVRVER